MTFEQRGHPRPQSSEEAGTWTLGRGDRQLRRCLRFILVPPFSLNGFWGVNNLGHTCVSFPSATPLARDAAISIHNVVDNLGHTFFSFAYATPLVRDAAISIYKVNVPKETPRRIIIILHISNEFY
jgi:hypothetical protein